MKTLIALLTLLPLAACAEASAAPEPDPAEVERLVASLERQSALPEKTQQKIRKAEPLVTTLQRSDPDRLTGMAERLLAR